jgi:hypothetical protein
LPPVPASRCIIILLAVLEFTITSSFLVCKQVILNKLFFLPWAARFAGLQDLRGFAPSFILNDRLEQTLQELKF